MKKAIASALAALLVNTKLALAVTSTAIWVGNGQVSAINPLPVTGSLTGGGAVTIASGGVASGAFASGSLTSGSVVDGAIVTLGAKADAKSAATDTTAITLMQVAKEISALLQGNLATIPTPIGGTALSNYSANVTSAGSGAGTGGVAVGSSGVRHLYGYQIANANSSMCYIQFLDQTQALTNLGTTVPVKSIGIPANGGANLMSSIPIITTATALTIGVTTARNGSTACSTGLDINLDYN
jgi:hypothetical protein